MRAGLLEQIAYIEAALDDPEHIEMDNYGTVLLPVLETCLAETEALIKSADDGRIMKRLNAHFIMEDSDFLTHLTGYEFGNIRNAYEDLENDWHAMYYYYGYIGIGSYILVIVYLAWRILKLLIRSFEESLTLLNFTLLLSFVILLGLAGFSGALFRRPNASIYLSLVIAMIWHATRLPDRLSHS